MALRRTAGLIQRLTTQGTRSLAPTSAAVQQEGSFDASTPCKASQAPFMQPTRGASNEIATTHGTNATVEALKNPSTDISYDETNHPRLPVGDPGKRAFTYFVMSGGRFIYASAIRLAVLKFLLSMTASDDVLAMASLEVDVSAIDVGQTITVKWRGKPVFIRRRSEKSVGDEQSVNVRALKDPEADADRVQRPEWLVLVGVCTHLGCVPISDAGDFGGWFCPCHGSHYDGSGRARKGPAPTNLEVPKYQFLSDEKILIG